LSVVNISKVFSYIPEDIRADVKLPIVSSRTDSIAEAADQNTLGHEKWWNFKTE